MESEKLDISVLYVDDDLALQLVYTHQIRKIVKTVYQANNGLEGLQLYRKQQPDLVISDIKMPLMTGLDMTSQIKKDFPDARIILLSAYDESAFLIRAIDLGVKVFLVKPVEINKILKSIRDQASEIFLIKQINEEVRLRHQVEENLLRNEQILQSVSESAERLLHAGFTNETVSFMLSRLGLSTQVSRVYIFEVRPENGKTLASQTYEWVAKGISSQQTNQELMNLNTDEPPFQRWSSLLRNGSSIIGNVHDLPKEEQNFLLPQQIISILIIPFFVNNSWHGFIGFDDCMKQRNWSQSEVNTITTAANVLGAAIQRTENEKQLISLNTELELRVKQRTALLENEIMERKHAENMLRESEEKYRLIFENANDGIIISANNTIQFLNPRFYELTGFYPYQITGKSLKEIIHPQFQSFFDKNFLSNQLDQKHPPFDVQLIHKSGRSFWVEVNSNIVIWDKQEVVLTFLTDIDARKNFEKELQTLNTELEERVQAELKQREKQQQFLLQKSRLESLGELAAGIAHEINQPLGGLSMSVENIMDEIQQKNLSEAYLKEKIKLIFSDIERIRDIIHHVRLFAREQEIDSQQVFKVTDAIQRTIQLVNRLYIDQEIDLRTSIADHEAQSVGNVTQFEQVLLNIFSNAKFAVDQKAKISKNYKKIISIDCQTAQNDVIITVTDNGSGISETNISNVFNPFFTTKEPEEGTGLGLSISYGIISDMGGTIEINSILTEFTEVKIILPNYEPDGD